AEAEDQPGGPQREQDEEREGTEDAQEGLLAARRAEQPRGGSPRPPPGPVVEAREAVRTGHAPGQDERLERLEQNGEDEQQTDGREGDRQGRTPGWRGRNGSAALCPRASPGERRLTAARPVPPSRRGGRSLPAHHAVVRVVGRL